MKGSRSRSQHPDRKSAKKEPVEDIKRGPLFLDEAATPGIKQLLGYIDAGSDRSFEDRPKASKVEITVQKDEVDSEQAECELDNFDPAEINDFFDGKTKKLY